MTGLTVAHVPTALTMQTDTLVTVASQLSTAQRAAGQDPIVTLAQDRDLHVADAKNLYVDYTADCPREYFTRAELAVDVLAGAVGARRPYYGRMWRPAVEAVADNGADAVLLYEGHYAAPSLPDWNRLRPRTKILLYVHNPLSRTYRRRELRRLLSLCDGVVFCADHLRSAVFDRLDGVSVPLHVVHNGVDPVFLTEPGQAHHQEGETFEVVFAGRVVPEKGPHLLLEALAAASASVRRPLRAQIVGSSTYREGELTAYERQLRSTAARNGLDVDFVPFVDKPRLRDIYRRASAVCLPSAWAEGLPLAALEAMSTGAPIIASQSPGLLEACGEAALYAPMGESAAIADAIVRLAEDPAEHSRRSAAAHARAQQFTWAKAAEEFTRIIRSA